MLIGGKPFASFAQPKPVIGKTLAQLITAPASAKIPAVSIAGNIPAATNPNIGTDIALNHARLYERPLVPDTKLPGVSFAPARGYLANEVPKIAMNPAAFGGSRFQTSLVENRIKLRERMAIRSAQSQTKFPTPHPAGQLGLAYLTGIKAKPRTLAGFWGTVGKTPVGKKWGRIDFAALTNVPTSTVTGVNAEQPISLYQMPETDDPTKNAPQVILPNQAADVAAVYAEIESGAVSTVDAPKDNKTLNGIVALALIGLVIFLVFKGRI